MYEHQAELIRSHKCPHCDGKRKVVDRDTYEEGTCPHCKGTGEPTEDDLERLELHDKGICLICKLPLIKGESSGSKYDPSGTNDCLDHLREYVFELEGTIGILEGRINELEAEVEGLGSEVSILDAELDGHSRP
jgi:hypothetical protein